MAKDLNKNGLANIYIKNIEPEIKDKLFDIAKHQDIKPIELGRKILRNYVKNYIIPKG